MSESKNINFDCEPSDTPATMNRPASHTPRQNQQGKVERTFFREIFDLKKDLRKFRKNIKDFRRDYLSKNSQDELRENAKSLQERITILAETLREKGASLKNSSFDEIVKRILELHDQFASLMGIYYRVSAFRMNLFACISNSTPTETSDRSRDEYIDLEAENSASANQEEFDMQPA